MPVLPHAQFSMITKIEISTFLGYFTSLTENHVCILLCDFEIHSNILLHFRSMKTEVLVRSKIEDPEVQRERAESVKSKSIGELSQIHSIDDIPLPSTIENWIGRSTSGRPVERKKKFREM